MGRRGGGRLHLRHPVHLAELAHRHILLHRPAEGGVGASASRQQQGGAEEGAEGRAEEGAEGVEEGVAEGGAEGGAEGEQEK